jgi:hypothetical protein
LAENNSDLVKMSFRFISIVSSYPISFFLIPDSYREE